MTELTGYRHITEAIERWRASGLYVPCDSAESRRRLQQVWLERYKKTDADSFMECVKVLSAGTHSPACTIWIWRWQRCGRSRSDRPRSLPHSQLLWQAGPNTIRKTANGG